MNSGGTASVLTSTSRMSVWLGLLVLLVLPSQTACNLLVQVPAPLLEEAGEAVPPLTAGEKLRFFLENLGEVSPGLAYRSAKPGESLIRFLAERAHLGHVLNFRGRPMPEVKQLIESLGGTYTTVRMRASRPPTPRDILEMIRVTLRARQEQRALLMHCYGGADRTGGMVAIWRMLFQGATDREELKREAVYFRHIPASHPNVFRTIDLFPVELFRPFVDNPLWLDDAARIAELETRYLEREPLASGSTTVHPGSLRAGAAKKDLLEGWSEQVQMATYGPLSVVSSRVREPVYARAVVLENDSVRLAIVSCDLLTTDAAMRRLVAARLVAERIELHDLLLSATHTHTSVGAYVDDWIYEFYMFGSFQAALRDHLARQIVAAVKAALENVRPARLGVGRAAAHGISYNRRLGDTVDPEVGIIRITDREGGPLAVVVNFAAHPILAMTDGQISPDYPGLLAKRLDAEFGFGLFLGGALGDLNAQPPGARGTPRLPQHAQEVADVLFAAIGAAAPAIDTREEVELGAMTMSFQLPPFNANPIPDLFFPLKWLVESLIDWPTYVPLQALRLGDAALVASASEITVGLGLDLKRRSPAPFTYVVTHAGAYAGYAIGQVNYPKKKLDPTSVVSLNGPTHGIKVVNAARKLVETLWAADEATPGTPAPAAENDTDGPGTSSPTLPQSRRFGHVAVDSIPDAVRVESSFSYLTHLRGGNGVRGRKREASARVAVRGPWDVLIDLEAGYVRSDWRTSQGRRGDEGASDLVFGAQRAFLIAADELEGHGLRAVPRAAFSAPTGDPDAAAPFAFAASSGVWRPTAGGALELTWSTYRTLTLESFYTTSFDRYRGRRPGDRWETTLSYSERHGLVSLFLGLATSLQLKDSRRSGRQEVDVQETSFDMGLRPGISVHVTESIELFGGLSVPLYRDGDGAGQGRGGVVGISAAF